MSASPLIVYLSLVALIALQRLNEMRRSAAHEAALKERGGYEVGAGHFPVMRALHTLWLVSCVVEATLLEIPYSRGVAGVGLVALLMGQGLRIAAIHALGKRWTVRVLVVPGEALVEHGIFRWIRHPNYVGVVIEMAALPLVFGCWWTAAVFSVGNLLLLRHRIGVEEAALAEASR
jgi:methyltransferase